MQVCTGFSVIIILFSMLCVWNVRGAGKRGLGKIVADFRKLYNFSVFAVLEPRISGSRAALVAKKFGFASKFIVDAEGFSGSIWLLWNPISINLEVVASSRHTITFVAAENKTCWVATIVYANPSFGIRRKLWQYLNLLRSCFRGPWVVLRDFNEIMHSSEKRGGRAGFSNSGFLDWVNDNCLVDLGFVGQKFTWTSRRGANEEICCRLDRAVCSMEWRTMFPEGFVKHLPRINSDHCPILLNLHSSHIPCSALKPFRFEATWMRHDGFNGVVRSCWTSTCGGISNKMHSLASNLKVWNKDSFGCIFKRKRVLLARILGIQRSLSGKYNSSLVSLENQLICEYNEIAKQDEVFWQQKSRINWLKNGDRNTKFFHLSTMIRRRRNKIEGLKDINGDWVEDKDGLKLLACNYFKTLFSRKIIDDDYSMLPQLFPTIDECSMRHICRGISDEDVKDSLFGIGGLKAPGPDGFPAAFFQDQWTICKSDLVKLVRDSFSNGNFPIELNQTFIALIPKIPSPLKMANFRPISLCNTAYKVISKIIVSRLRNVMADLVGPNQVAFVPGRQIQDNIVVAQETLHKFHVSKSKKGFVAWKIELAKAYDKIQWDFIEMVLLEVGLSKHFIELIMFSIRSVKYKVLINGEASYSFSSGCGIRQGDPISPYLFVLCMEKLSHIISDYVSKGLWKPIMVTRGGPLISHLFFVDDLILFGHAFVQQAMIMKKCLDTFCSCSGQEVSFAKSRVFCSRMVRAGFAKQLAGICGSPITNDLGKYLGVPLLHG
ncbi:hypothetical protein ACOSQ2_012124 [Xanthoceras sorbifolium]